MKIRKSSHEEHVLWVAWFHGRIKDAHAWEWTMWDRHWSCPSQFWPVAQQLAQAGLLQAVQYSIEHDAECRGLYRSMLVNRAVKYEQNISQDDLDRMVNGRKFREDDFFLRLTFKGYVEYYRASHSKPLWLRWRRFKVRVLYDPWQVRCPGCVGWNSYGPDADFCPICCGNETVWRWRAAWFWVRDMYWRGRACHDHTD